MAKKILLIEYEPRYLDRIRGYLAGKDFDLVVAKDGDEGLDAYRKSRPDIVLVSSVLPKLRTQDVIRGMQSGGPTPPILLMMSGYKGKNKQADAQRIGATNILEKPFTDEDLLAEIDRALGTAAPPFEVKGPLLSADDIFSDVLSGMDETPHPAPAPATPGTDPGIQKKLEQTLSGILPGPRRAPSSTAVPRPDTGSVPRAAVPPPTAGGERTMKLDVSSGFSTPRAPEKTPEKVPEKAPERPAEKHADRPAPQSAVDRMLTETLSGLGRKSGTAEKPDTASVPRAAVPAPKPPPPLDIGMPGLSRPAPRPVEPKPEPAPAVAAPAVPARAPAAPAPAAPAAAPAPAAQVEAKRPEAPKKDERRRETGTVVPGSGFGRYQLLEKIASGGMAEVYKARMRGEEGFEKIVAIKRILPHMADNDDFITMFIDEAKLAAQLTHNNIIHIYDLGKVDQYHFIAMEFVDGKDLRSIVKLAQERAFPLPVELALFVASKIANALDYAHRRSGPDGQELNLVHRDVSPQNILISFEGDIKLCDFGIAKATTKVSQTQTGALKGKLQYMSPEQAWGKKIDRRTDIFSLGIVLFEMLTGERLFTGDTDLTILEQVRDARVVAPSTKNSEVPKKVDQIVLKALAKDAKDRYQNASELEKDLNAVLYSYQPAPGPADLAIYMHRLLESQAPVSDEQIDAAFASAAAAPPAAEPQKKGKGLVISKKAPAPERPAEAPAAPPAAPIEVSQPSLHLSPVEAPRSRTGLYAGIGIAAVVLIAVGVVMTRGKDEKGPEPAPTPAAVAAATPSAASIPTVAPVEAERVVDPKQVEAEARRLALLEAEKLRAAAKTPGPGAAPAPTAAGVALVPKAPLEPPKPAAEPTKAPVPTPTAVPVVAPTLPPARPTPETVRVAEAIPPTKAPAPAVTAAPATGAALKEGDLVGPGEGVVEPRIVRLGTFKLPPQARQIQMKRGASDQGLGTPIIMALVTEKGAVAEARVLRPSAYSFVDEAAIQALKSGKIEPATKNGIRVKMWKAFPITVRP